MNRILSLFPILMILLMGLSSCEDILNDGLSEDDVIAGLKQALEVSSDTSVNQASKVDGYNANQAIRILLPAEVIAAQGFINNLPGGQNLTSALVVQLNRAAEDAAIKAKPILINAITNITIQDGFDILRGNDSAATQYLKSATFIFDAMKLFS